jgi:hypothetical protein
VLKGNSLAITAYAYNGMITFSVVSMEKQKEMEEFPGD